MNRDELLGMKIPRLYEILNISKDNDTEEQDVEW